MLHTIFEKLQRKQQLSLLKKHPHVSVGNIRLGINDHFILSPDLKKMVIGKSVSLRNYIHILVGSTATLEIGNHVFMNNFCSVNCLDSIYIGENTLFGENVKLYDHNHSYSDSPEFKIHHSEFNKAPIKIGKNCWLGSNVTILKGVTVGDNCIIGSGCTVYKDVPENTTLINQQQLTVKSRIQ